MLAYVFWHWGDRQIKRPVYEQHLMQFHLSLQAKKPVGFHSSMVLRAKGLPWFEQEGDIYEDWYLVENSAGLDPLDEAAVNVQRRETHDQLAQMAKGGTGGLYRLRAGNAYIPAIQNASWFSKPAGMSYAALYELLEPYLKQTPGNLWQRQMTLGPALEFCWHTDQNSPLPAELTVLQLSLAPIWP